MKHWEEGDSQKRKQSLVAVINDDHSSESAESGTATVNI